MKQMVEIDVPEGKKAIWKDNKIVFEDIISSNTLLEQLPKTWKEFCSQNKVREGEWYLDECGELVEVEKGGRRDENIDKNMLPSNQAAEQYIVLMQLHQLRDCYRQGWVPDWGDGTYKYIITYFKGHYYVNESMFTKGFLSFKYKYIAMEFLTNFHELIEQVEDFI